MNWKYIPVAIGGAVAGAAAHEYATGKLAEQVEALAEVIEEQQDFMGTTHDESEIPSVEDLMDSMSQGTDIGFEEGPMEAFPGSQSGGDDSSSGHQGFGFDDFFMGDFMDMVERGRQMQQEEVRRVLEDGEKEWQELREEVFEEMPTHLFNEAALNEALDVLITEMRQNGDLYEDDGKYGLTE